MRENFNFIPDGFGESHVHARSGRAAIYIHPDDVTSDPELTIAEKRAILASWISDARAVENAPALRRLESGAVVEVDAILQALGRLDGLAADPKGQRRQTSLLGRRLSAVSRSWRRIGSPPADPTTMMTTLPQLLRASEFPFVRRTDPTLRERRSKLSSRAELPLSNLGVSLRLRDRAAAADTWS